MNKYIKNEIYKKIDLALKSNRLYAFLMGTGIYEIEAGNMNKDMVLNTGAIMKALYEYCENKSDISAEIQKNLEFLANTKSFKAVYTVLNIVLYQLKAEKNNISPFMLDNETILNILSNNLKINKEMYSKSGELGNYVLENGMMNLLINYDNNLSNDYGYKIL